MRKTEQKLWDRMRKNVPDDFLVKRVENLVETGMPDTVGIVKESGKVFWIEMKSIENIPVRADTPLLNVNKGCSQEQKNWHMQWWVAKGTSYILVGVGSDQMLLLGCLADQINMMSFTDMAHASVATQWDDIFDFIKGFSR